MRYLYILIFLVLMHISAKAQVPATEVRAAWLTTNWALDWPEIGASTESQKTKLKHILDELQSCNFNVVFFQVRAQGQVFYNSSIEPKSTYFNHSGGFDPLAFAIEESHKRGMECHAWIVTYPGATPKNVPARKGKKGGTEVKPDYYKVVDKKWYMDPGRPETNQHLLSIVKEIVKGYDVDGIHFDYIRYPNANRKFPDDATYRKYGNGQNLYDWRRDNINQLVAQIYDTTKSIKKWVQVSSSPLGRYKALRDVNPNIGWTAYETVFQDPGQWMQAGKHDMIFPMIYYKDRGFNPYLDDWIANSHGRIVVPGLGVYQMLDDQAKWSLSDIQNQMEYSRTKEISGQAYFRVGMIMNNTKGLKDSFKSFYPYPAKLPPLHWLDDEASEAPTNLEVYKDDAGYLQIHWNTPEDDSDVTYTIYASNEDEVDMEDASLILETGVRGNSLSFEASVGEYGFYYIITASDRYHNESELSSSVYFSHSENEQ